MYIDLKYKNKKGIPLKKPTCRIDGMYTMDEDVVVILDVSKYKWMASNLENHKYKVRGMKKLGGKEFIPYSRCLPFKRVTDQEELYMYGLDTDDENIFLYDTKIEYIDDINFFKNIFLDKGFVVVTEENNEYGEFIFLRRPFTKGILLLAMDSKSNFHLYRTSSHKPMVNDTQRDLYEAVIRKIVLNRSSLVVKLEVFNSVGDNITLDYKIDGRPLQDFKTYAFYENIGDIKAQIRKGRKGQLKLARLMAIVDNYTTRKELNDLYDKYSGENDKDTQRLLKAINKKLKGQKVKVLIGSNGTIRRILPFADKVKNLGYKILDGKHPDAFINYIPCEEEPNNE